MINTGATTIGGSGIAAAGDIDITAMSPLTIDAPVSSASGSVSLTASYPGTLTLTPSAAFSAVGPIVLAGTGAIVGTPPPGASFTDNSGDAPLPAGSIDQQLNCLINPATCNLAPSSDTRQAIDDTLDKINLTQQVVVETTTLESAKPARLVVAGTTDQPSGKPEKDKKDESKKDEPEKQDQGAKKDEPAKKMYCN